MKSKTRAKALSWLLSLVLMLSLLLGMSLTAEAEDQSPKVTLDFTNSSYWNIPGSNTTAIGSYTNGTHSINLYGTGSNGYKMNGGYLLLGKTDSYLELPAFNFDVEKIVVTGKSGASANVQFNVFVGDYEASTAVTGSQGTQTFEIESGYQSAGNVYKLKVLNNYNVQFTKIEIYEKPSNTVTETTSVQVVDKDAFVGNDGLGNLRFVTQVDYDEGKTVEYYGTWFVPENLLTDTTKEKGDVRYNSSIESGKSFTADLLAIPANQLNRVIVGVSYVKIQGADEVQTDVTTATVEALKNETSK